MPAPTPETIAVIDQVNASVAWRAGAWVATSIDTAEIDGATRRPATIAGRARIQGEATSACSAIGSASSASNHGELPLDRRTQREAAVGDAAGRAADRS